MKAKELHQKYLDFLSKKEQCYENQPEKIDIDELDASIGVCYLLLKDANELLIIRNCKLNSAVESIFKELNQKWLVVHKLINNSNVRKCTFETVVKKIMPETYAEINPNVWR